MRNFFSPILTICLLLPAWLGAQPLPPMSPAQAQTVDSILSLMTLEEKIGQMTLFTSDWDVTGPTLRENYQEDIRAGKVGAVFNAHTAAYTRDLQRLAVEETRLGIPLLFGYDVIHGYKTIFPIPLGESASWNLERIEQAARVAAIEASAAGLHWTFAPMVDIARDPRWGRIAEGSGESVYLGQAIAAARVRGFQGEDLADPRTVLACAKHFAAYGAAQAGRDYHTVDISRRTLFETYLPPFEAALDAGAATYMTSFNELDGVPASGNRFLLTEILREQWGFNGFVVTDYTSINEMVPHGIVADEKEAGALAANAGVDMDMQGAVFYDHLAELVTEGSVSEAQVDQAVRRILYLKLLLGLFEDPYRYSDVARQEELVFNPLHRQAARAMARESMVLLENRNRALPLTANLQSVAVIGPLANEPRQMLGNWFAAGDGDSCVTPLAGLQQALLEKAVVRYAQGCAIEENEAAEDFAEAVALAEESDVIVACVGEAGWMSGEAASRSQLDLPGRQLELLQRLKATGKPLIVVVFSGRPLAINWLAENADALVAAWFPGTMAGHALADLLTGQYNFSGKLPITFPRNVGQVPIFLSMKNTGRPMNPADKYTSKYLDVPNTPLYPLGYGLSYSRFAYEPLEVRSATFAMDEEVEISVGITNLSDTAGTEVVQLYVRDRVGSVTRPVRELKGFQRVDFGPGERKVVTFTLTADDLAFYTRDMSLQAEPGEFDVWVGGSSATDNGTTIRLKQ